MQHHLPRLGLDPWVPSAIIVAMSELGDTAELILAQTVAILHEGGNSAAVDLLLDAQHHRLPRRAQSLGNRGVRLSTGGSQDDLRP